MAKIVYNAVMTELYFVRHAQSVSGWVDDASRPLTEDGKRDAKQVARVLLDTPLEAVVSSPYLCCLDTVRPCAASHGLDIETDARLRQRKSGPGGLSQDMTERRFEDFSFSETGGESLFSVQTRVNAAVRDLLSAYEGRSILVCTHGTTLSMVLHAFLPVFSLQNHLQLLQYLPYIIRTDFDGDRLINREELLMVQK